VRFIFGCGGTGGHIYPALALAKTLSQQKHTCSFIGNATGMEAEIVKRHHYLFHPIRVEKLSRTLHPSLFGFPFHLLSSIINCLKYIRKTKPDAVICTGGFVSGPVAIAAIISRIPLYFHESNSLPGLTIKALAKYSRITFVSWESSQKRLQQAKTQLVPIPLLPRDATDEEADLAALGIDPHQPVILVSGGSQGSLMINRTIDSALDAILQRGWQLIWQTGSASFAEFSSRHKDKEGLYIFPFSPILPLLYEKATLAITRAGAMTIAELEEARLPAILIPLPTAAENHQFYNASEQESKGLAICLQQSKLSPENLILAISLLLKNRQDYLQRLNQLPPNTASADICHIITQDLTPGGPSC